MRTEIIVTVIVQGFHYWESAKESVDFLHFMHLHNFKIVAFKQVDELDREIEFFEFAEKIKKFIAYHFDRYPSKAVNAIDFGPRSCEQIAKILLEGMALTACEIWEDDMVGAKVYA